MQDYQKAFIDFALRYRVLQFGEFVLKSGRLSPYFFNTGLFDTGAALSRLGRFYCDAILDSGIGFDMVYGPAYKGIPLASSVAIGLAEHHDRDVPYCFNRKEVKDHGEGGITLGAPLEGRVLIVDDVISAGTSVNESVAIIRAAGAEPVGVCIAMDRQERGRQGESSAIEEVERRHGLKVTSIIDLATLIHYLEEEPELEAHLEAIREYQKLYGVSRPAD